MVIKLMDNMAIILKQVRTNYSSSKLFKGKKPETFI